MFAALPQDSGQLVGTPTIQIHCRSFFAGFHLKLSKCGAASICLTLMMFMYSKSTVYTPDNPTKSSQPTECPEIRNHWKKTWTFTSNGLFHWFFTLQQNSPILKMPNSLRKPIPSMAPNLGGPASFHLHGLGILDTPKLHARHPGFFHKWKSCLCIKIRKNIYQWNMGMFHVYILFIYVY